MPVFIAQHLSLPSQIDTVSSTRLMIVLADNETDARRAFIAAAGPPLEFSVEELPPADAAAVQGQLQPNVAQPYEPSRS